MKFRSLFFQELCVSRKTILLSFLLFFAWLLLAWAVIFSAEIGVNDDAEQNAVLHTLSLVTAMVGSIPLLADESFKANLNAGWLNYSYALPITPLERAAARFVRRFSVALVCVLLSLCNAAAIGAYLSVPFRVNTVVWHIVILAAMAFFSLPNELLVLRARNCAALKKMQSAAGLTMVGLTAAVVIVIFKAAGIDLEALTRDEVTLEFPVFTAEALLWAVPLLLLTMAASFFAAYHSLGSAYPNAKMLKKKKSGENAPAIALPAKTDGTTGLLYKELKQNRLMIVLAALAPILLTAFPFTFTAIGAITGGTDIRGFFEMATNPIIRGLMFAVGIFVLNALTSEVFRGDDKKHWAYFVVSTPQGVKAFLYRKYAVVLMMNLLYMIGGFFADNLLSTLNYFVTGEELISAFSSFYAAGVFLMLLIGAFDIPFTVRCGSKKGSLIKMIAMLLLCAAAILVYNLLPSEAAQSLTDAVVSLLNGALLWILSLFPYLALAAFLYSYQISCMVFMKGVNEYDR